VVQVVVAHTLLELLAQELLIKVMVVEQVITVVDQLITLVVEAVQVVLVEAQQPLVLAAMVVLELHLL
jgi:hypothetical protein